jgi:hypothetical protein
VVLAEKKVRLQSVSSASKTFFNIYAEFLLAFLPKLHSLLLKMNSICSLTALAQYSNSKSSLLGFKFSFDGLSLRVAQDSLALFIRKLLPENGIDEFD